MLNRGQQSKQPKVPDANNSTTLRLDMSSAPGVWTTGPAFAQGRADFGLAYDAGTNKLYALGGDTTGGGFFDSTNLVDELSVASWPAGSWAASPPNLILPNRQANQAGFYGSGQIWSVGGIVGQTFQFLAEVQRRSNGSGPCGTPTATPTPYPTPPDGYTYRYSWHTVTHTDVSARQLIHDSSDSGSIVRARMTSAITGTYHCRPPSRCPSLTRCTIRPSPISIFVQRQCPVHDDRCDLYQRMPAVEHPQLQHLPVLGRPVSGE